MNVDHDAESADILVVDDIPANLHLLAGLLRERGYKVRPAPDDPLALQAARQAPPDLILLDVSMPGMDGFEVCARFKEDPRLRGIPVLFVSAHGEVLDKVRAFAVGGVDYLTKPFQIEEVHARVAAHLQIRRQQRALQESYDRLRDLERLRDDLVHMVIHDLRSPLAVLTALLELLSIERGDALPPGSQQDLAAARAAAERLAGMVGSILAVSKLEAGRLVPARSDFDLAALVRDVAQDMRPLAGQRAIEVACDPAALEVSADRELLARVLQNLLSNAIKFTGSRGRVRIAAEEGAGGARVTVADDGPGVPAELRERIFEKFAQVGAVAGPRRLPSTGLGLAFCKLAVEAHGGRVGVDEAPGGGAIFWFTLPGRAAAPPGGCGTS